ncbi:MAG: hypothetical protein Q8R28_16825 [Dehalococcoidia bacterium]|nr:hypothetical protein [Dehalococcoidia bacterium]
MQQSTQAREAVRIARSMPVTPRPQAWVLAPQVAAGKLTMEQAVDLLLRGGKGV